jgi:hypothetical protein
MVNERRMKELGVTSRAPPPTVVGRARECPQCLRTQVPRCRVPCPAGCPAGPMPTLTAPDQPTERLVPESRRREPGTGREIVTPSYYERSTTDGMWQAPPPSSYSAPAGSPARILQR